MESIFLGLIWFNGLIFRRYHIAYFFSHIYWHEQVVTLVVSMRLVWLLGVRILEIEQGGVFEIFKQVDDMFVQQMSDIRWYQAGISIYLSDF